LALAHRDDFENRDLEFSGEIFDDLGGITTLRDQVENWPGGHGDFEDSVDLIRDGIDVFLTKLGLDEDPRGDLGPVLPERPDETEFHEWPNILIIVQFFLEFTGNGGLFGVVSVQELLPFFVVTLHGVWELGVELVGLTAEFVPGELQSVHPS